VAEAHSHRPVHRVHRADYFPLGPLRPANAVHWSRDRRRAGFVMSQFENLVFEGGGVKGIAYAGAIAVLEKNGVLADIRRVAGTSAGAIMACLLALGADAARAQAITDNTPFASFED